MYRIQIKIFEYSKLVLGLELNLYSQEMLTKIQSNPSPLGYSIFLLQMVLENIQFEFM